MKNMKKKILISFSILVVSLVTIAWASVKITGGGLLINSSNGQPVATLTLQCHNCTNDNYSASGKFNLVDHQTGAHLKGSLRGYVQCTPNSDPNGLDYATDCKLFCNASYLPGAHLLYGKDDNSGAPLAVCIQDNGNGNTDRATVVIPPSGSSQVFRRFDTTLNGNFKVH